MGKYELSIFSFKKRQFETKRPAPEAGPFKKLKLDSGSANVSLNLDSTMAWVSSLNW